MAFVRMHAVEGQAQGGTEGAVFIIDPKHTE